jgi:membrane protease YdiL (CAAX protease family)
MNFTNYAISAFFQLALFALIPFLTYLISRKKLSGFMTYLGLFPHPLKNWKKSIGLFLLAYALLLAGLVIISLTHRPENTNTIGGSFGQSGLSLPLLILAILLYGFVQTGLSEELLFRGFLAKRLIGWLGFLPGNLIQAALFGLAHFFTLSGAPLPVRVLHILLAGAGGFIFAYVNEKEAAGSILPSWIAHGLFNTISAAIMLVGNM